MARYLVSGGCGFIGSHLVDELLRKGNDVIIVDNLSTGKIKNLNSDAILHQGDICDHSLMKTLMRDCNGCFHLAAVASVEASINQWVVAHKTNLTGTITILDIAKDLNKIHRFPVVYASSAAVYGASQNYPFKETDITKPISPYGIDKLSCEMQAKFAGNIHNMPNIGLRFFNVYGERQDPRSPYSGVISIFLNRMLENKTINVFGDGNQVRDFIYINDIVRYLIKAMKEAGSSSCVYNACTGNDSTLNQLIATLGSIMHIEPNVAFKELRTGDIKISKGDAEFATRNLNITANTDLYDGLKNMLIKI